MIEFIPWYHAGSDLLRCLSCAALVVSGDIEVHTKWHEKVEGEPDASDLSSATG